MKKQITKTGVVVEMNGAYWGVQDSDHHSTNYGWGPVENAHIGDPRYLKRPQDATWPDSHYVKKLSKGRILPIRVTTEYEVDDE